MVAVSLARGTPLRHKLKTKPSTLFVNAVTFVFGVFKETLSADGAKTEDFNAHKVCRKFHGNRDLKMK